MIKKLFLSLALIFGATAAWGAELPPVLKGNWSTVDGGQQWTYGFYPTGAVWRNAFWDYADITTKGPLITLQLRERGLGMDSPVVTVYARWNPKDSVALIGLSPKSLTPHSHQIIAQPTYRIPEAGDRDFPGRDTLLHDGVAVVRGVLGDYRPGTHAATVLINAFNLFTRQDTPVVGDIAADGSFEVQIPLGHPINCQISMGHVFYDDLYLEPGDTLMLWRSVTGRQGYPQESSRYMGTHGRVNHELNRLQQRWQRFDGNTMQILNNMVPDSARRFMEHWSAVDSAASERYIAENGISRRGAFLARWTPRAAAMMYLGTYAMYREDVPARRVPDTFHYFYRRLPMDDARMMGIRMYSSLINRLEFSPVFWKPPFFQKIRYRALAEAGYAVDPEDRLRMDSLEFKLLTIPGDSAATAKAYNRVFKALHEKYGPGMTAYNLAQDMTRYRQYARDFWGHDLPLLTELVMARRVHSGCFDEATKPIPNRFLAPLVAGFTVPYAVGTILDANDALKPKVIAREQGPYVPGDRGERLLDSLMTPHRGRVVFVDFWDMGCGPCRQGMMESWKLKKILADRPVDFVYITSIEGSPEAAAEKFITDNKITGRQVRITQDEWNILSARFGIAGIPHYMIVGQDGRVVNPHYRGAYVPEETAKELIKAIAQ